jgi:uncharacterized protein YggT (Ycf19 family)
MNLNTINSGKILLYFINFVFGLIEIFIALRIIFLLLAANPNTPFINWIYDVTKTLLTPFQGIFPSPVFRGGSVLDISALVAMLIYALINYLISEFVRFISFNSTNYYVTRTKSRDE